MPQGTPLFPGKLVLGSLPGRTLSRQVFLTLCIVLSAKRSVSRCERIDC
jgi:hypothetical protein